MQRNEICSKPVIGRKIRSAIEAYSTFVLPTGSGITLISVTLLAQIAYELNKLKNREPSKTK